MSGWLDWIEEDINCPFCEEGLLALFCEVGDPNRIPIVITELVGGKTTCPKCKKEITDNDIEERNIYI